ncbi:ParB/RepB/Spo0J family partition protein [Thermomonospora umbrina]|uniref:ParB-like nuclease family protein n=1 Tax=Thermomonospora umbrina TaxID=111806 RepID=A0A3D9SX68_9ACTN|nr:ParB N-terminal domain-containing protein [Thermomonospora umbrina]REF00553.1 ParB-like nuclease family protein [Thermomonospora umbrina]
MTDSTTLTTGDDTASPDDEQHTDWVHQGPGVLSGTISVDRLRSHPDHVRESLDLDQRLLKSIAAIGVVQPLLIVPDPEREGFFLVIDGHRKMEGARIVGQTHPHRKMVPFYLDTERSGDLAAQHLTQFITNDDGLGRPHSLHEQLTAIRLASDAGADLTFIRQATGMTSKETRRSLKVSRMAPPARQAAREAGMDTLEEMELIHEFQNDPDALATLMQAKEREQKLSYVAARIREDRAATVEHRRIVKVLEEAQVPITDNVPDDAVRLAELVIGASDADAERPESVDDTPDGQSAEIEAVPLTFEAHRDCPGRGATFAGYDPRRVIHYCTDPHAHGHRYRHPVTEVRMRQRAELITAGRTVTGRIPVGAEPLTRLRHAGRQLDPETHRTCPGSAVSISAHSHPVEYCTDPRAYGHTLPTSAAATAPPATSGTERRLVIEGNKAWKASTPLRQQWLSTNLFARRRTPRDTTAFLAEELLRWPRILNEVFGTPSQRVLLTKLLGRTNDELVEELSSASDGKRRMWVLAAIAASYEHQMDGPNERGATWRTDAKYNPHCRREDAGRYLRFLIGQGYEPSPIERAVADGVPYTGDDLGDTIDGEPADDSSRRDAADPDHGAASQPSPEPDTGTDLIHEPPPAAVDTEAADTEPPAVDPDVSAPTPVGEPTDPEAGENTGDGTAEAVGDDEHDVRAA